MNINDYAWVKLTPLGREIHRKDHVQFQMHYPNVDLPYSPPVETNGWSKWHLWQIMQTFGKFCGVGFDLPFGTEIIFTDPSQSAKAAK